jgi:hypothetical protein
MLWDIQGKVTDPNDPDNEVDCVSTVPDECPGKFNYYEEFSEDRTVYCDGSNLTYPCDDSDTGTTVLKTTGFSTRGGSTNYFLGELSPEKGRRTNPPGLQLWYGGTKENPSAPEYERPKPCPTCNSYRYFSIVDRDNNDDVVFEGIPILETKFIRPNIISIFEHNTVCHSLEIASLMDDPNEDNLSLDTAATITTCQAGFNMKACTGNYNCTKSLHMSGTNSGLIWKDNIFFSSYYVGKGILSQGSAYTDPTDCNDCNQADCNCPGGYSCVSTVGHNKYGECENTQSIDNRDEFGTVNSCLDDICPDFRYTNRRLWGHLDITDNLFIRQHPDLMESYWTGFDANEGIPVHGNNLAYDREGSDYSYRDTLIDVFPDIQDGKLTSSKDLNEDGIPNGIHWDNLELLDIDTLISIPLNWAKSSERDYPTPVNFWGDECPWELDDCEN